MKETINLLKRNGIENLFFAFAGAQRARTGVAGLRLSLLHNAALSHTHRPIAHMIDNVGIVAHQHHG